MKFHPTPLTRGPSLRRMSAFCLAGTGLFSSCSPVQPTTTTQVSSPPPPPKHADATFPQFMPDPLEPANRGMWAVNHGILVGVMQPTGRVYRTIVPPPARQSINNFAHNIIYPTRLVNNALQGRWQGAGDESLRFLCNTTVGVGGLFDVATKWNIPKSEASFGQTFVRWGWKPETFLMIPVTGPSDPPNAAGLAADAASEPWNYARPFVYASYGTSYNRLTDRTEEAVQLIHTESDPYVGVKNLWTYASKDGQPDWSAPGPKDPGTLQTLGVAMIKPTNPNFLQDSRTMSVRMSSTGRSMSFNYWLQKNPAPLVYVSPGQGLHRESSTTLALAEMIYQSGCSVVTTTGVFHPDFMENASTTDLPAYPPVDCGDLLREYTDFDRALVKRHPGLLGKRALVGFSMGGFQALYLAAHEKQAPADMIHFDRYVAIDTPVDLRVGYKSIDACYEATKAWPAAERQEKVNNTIHKVASLWTLPPDPTAAPPFNAIESKFLIGMSFKLTLRDTIYSSQSRNNMGVLQTPVSKWRRDASYDEILRCSFDDYFNRFVLPYYKQKGVSARDFDREVNLRTYQSRLSSNPKVRVIVNRNDFILQPRDISWLQSTLPASRVTVFPDGGHIGNLTAPPVRQKIAQYLEGLQ